MRPDWVLDMDRKFDGLRHKCRAFGFSIFLFNAFSLNSFFKKYCLTLVIMDLFLFNLKLK